VALADGADLLALVKPMFELHLGRLPDDQEAGLADALATASAGAAAAGWTVLASDRSPVLGRGGAVEGFLHARRTTP
jgi:predicted rRNA methylase YqxC with S4 and FtsJ domains